MVGNRGRLAGLNPTLDESLSGGLSSGSFFLVEGEEGAGATELAFTVARAATRAKDARKVRWLTGIRSGARAKEECEEIFEDPKLPALIEFREMRGVQASTDCILSLADLGPGDVVIIESAAALARAEAGKDVTGILRHVGDLAHDVGAILILVHTLGTLPPLTESALAEISDGIFTLTWRDGGQTRKRILMLRKMRGLPVSLALDSVPVFEVALHRGTGFALSRVKTVV